LGKEFFVFIRCEIPEKSGKYSGVVTLTRVFLEYLIWGTFHTKLKNNNTKEKET
jgi:hypothetical protein